MYTRFQRHWDKVRLFYIKGIINKPDNYEYLRWSNIEARIDQAQKSKVPMNQEYIELLNKFYKRYPDVKYTIGKNTPGTVGKAPQNPAMVFIEKQLKLIDEGYSENKAFEIVEKEMADVFDKQREENRILRGFALNNRARSYLNYSQQLAEVEGRAKVQQLERDLNKYTDEENRWSDLLHGNLEENQRRLAADKAPALEGKIFCLYSCSN